MDNNYPFVLLIPIIQRTYNFVNILLRNSAKMMRESVNLLRRTTKYVIVCPKVEVWIPEGNFLAQKLRHFKKMLPF